MSALFGSEGEPYKILLVTKHFIERCVMCLSFHCRSSIEGIVDFFDLVVGWHISKGGIDRIRKRASEKAIEFDRKIPLDGIKEIAIDEIFQQGKPVLTGVDLDSNFTFLMEETEDRSGETWAQKLSEQKERGLQAELNVSDSGAGLRKGVQQVFPGIALQPDIFHALRGLGREVRAIDRHGEGKLSAYYKLEARVYAKSNEHPPFDLWIQYDEMGREIDTLLSKVDDVQSLYGWLVETLALTGQGYSKSLSLCQWVLDEMKVRFPEREKYQKEVRIFRRNLPEILSYLLRLETKMWQRAEEEFPHLNGHDFLLLYQQKFEPSGTERYEWMEQRLYQRFGKRLPEARAALEEMLYTTRRASSTIENLNGRLRCFMNLKREIPARFFSLIKVFFNTKKQHRSRCPDRCETSAVERLCGKPYPEFLDLVSAPMDYSF